LRRLPTGLVLRARAASGLCRRLLHGVRPTPHRAGSATPTCSSGARLPHRPPARAPPAAAGPSGMAALLAPLRLRAEPPIDTRPAAPPPPALLPRVPTGLPPRLPPATSHGSGVLVTRLTRRAPRDSPPNHPLSHRRHLQPIPPNRDRSAPRSESFPITTSTAGPQLCSRMGWAGSRRAGTFSDRAKLPRRRLIGAPHTGPPGRGRDATC